MRFKHIIGLRILLNPLIFQLTKGLFRYNLISNNLNYFWNMREEIDKYCFNSAENLVVLPNNLRHHQSNFLSSSFPDQIPSYVFGKNGENTLQKYQRLRQIYHLEPIHVDKKIYPASSVTIFLEHDIDFSKLLKNLRNSVWWNSRAKFLLINFNVSGCEFAQTFLSVIWSFNIISAIYLCQNRENLLVLYTFNPYSYIAPKFWIQETGNIGTDRHEWTIFKHTFQYIDELPLYNHSSWCKSLYFDKSQNMYGYNLRIYSSALDFRRFNTNRIGYEKCVAGSQKLMCDFLKAMNATFTSKLFIYVGLIYPDGKPYNSTNEVFSGILDLMAPAFFLRQYWWLQTYPYLNDDLKVVTSTKLRYTFHLYFTFESTTWLLLALFATLTVLFFKYALQHSPALEFIRILVSSSTLREPQRNSERVCFIFFIYMWLILNVYVQSNFQVERIKIKNDRIDSVEDLIKSDFPIHGLSSFKEFILDERIRRRLIDVVSYKSCFKFVSRGEPIACMLPLSLLKVYLNKNASVHVSKGKVVERGYTWIFSEDSPLLEKVNSIISRLNQAGIIKFYFELDHLDVERKIFRDTDQFDMSELIIALRVLLAGWLLAIAAFISELVIAILSNHTKIMY